MQVIKRILKWRLFWNEVYLTRPQSSLYRIYQRRERWVPRKGAQDEMGSEKTKEEDDVFSPSPPSHHPLLFHLARCRVLHEDDWGRVRRYTGNRKLITWTIQRNDKNVK